MNFFIISILYCTILSNSTDVNHAGQSTPESYFINRLDGSQINYSSSDPRNLKLDFLLDTNRHILKDSGDPGNTVTNTYTVESSYMIREVVEGKSKVWMCTDTFRSAKVVTQVTKKGLTQLVSLRNDDNEELYLKRQKTMFVRVPKRSEFEELKNLLETPGEYVDTWVELDLGKPVPNPLYFSNELIYYDGVPKFEVKPLEPFQIYRVFDSQKDVNSFKYNLVKDTLWVHEANLECKYLYFHVFEELTLVELVIYGPKSESCSEEVKYFKKQDTWDSINKNKFESKYQELKAKIKNVDFDFDLSSSNYDKFYNKVNKMGEYSFLSLYPKTGNHLKKLVYRGDQVSILGKDERFSPLVLHLKDREVVLVSAQVWKSNKVLKWLQFKKTNRGFVPVDKKTFDDELSKHSTSESSFDHTLEYLDSGGDDEEEDEEAGSEPADEDAGEKSEGDVPYQNLLDSLVGVKFNVLYDVDEKYFRQVKSTDGDFEVHTVSPKENYFVNLVDSRHGLVWKAMQDSYHAKSLVVYFRSESAKVLKLHLMGHKLNNYKYFMFSKDKWVTIGVTGFYKLLNKHEQSLTLFN